MKQLLTSALILIITSFSSYSQNEKTYDKIFKKHLKSDFGDLILVQKDDLYGLIDLNGFEIVEPKYQFIGKFKSRNDFATEWALVKKDDMYGFIDIYGQEVVESKYDKLYIFKENNGTWMKYKLDDQFGFLNSEGYEVITD